VSEGHRGARASALFLALSGIPPADREAWLAAQCGHDDALRRQVESLLGGLEAPPDFLDPAALHPPALDADIALAPGTRIGEFTVQRVIGSGSAGIVYSALQQRPRRTVALKILRRGLAASSARRRFEVEAELLGQLHHPGIAQIFAAHPGDDTTPPFIALEMVDGPAITEHVRAAGLDVRARVDLMARVCDAVQHAHQHGVIHRDLKPGNVLVGHDGRPKVVDFGVARASGAAVAITTINTEVGQLVGTVPYMSPEQLAALPGDIDTRSDVYALGVILFRLITGRLPFADGEPALPELARRIALDDPPRLSQVDASLGGDLETIVACALAKDRERRYASAADLASDLRRWLAGEPVAASADSGWYVVRRRLARYRRALAASAAAVATLLALSAYALVQRSHAERTNVQLADELSASNVERGRLLGRAGNLLGAEELLWDELFQRPESRHARWALWEVYAREAPIWTRVVDPGGTETVRFSPDASRLYTAGRDGRVRVISPLTGNVQQVFEGHTGPVTLLTLSPAGDVITAAADGLRVWRLDGTRLAIPVDVNLESIVALDEGSIAAAAGDGFVRVWSTEDGRLVRTFELHDAPIIRLAASARGELLAAGSADGMVTAWDPAAGRVRWRRKVHDSAVAALAFNPATSVLVSGGADQWLALLAARSGEVLDRLEPRNGTVRSLAFDVSGRRLAVAGWWRADVWDMEDLRSAPGGASQGAWRADISADGRWLATSDGPDGPVRVWELDPDSRLEHANPHQDRVVGLAVPDGQARVVSAGIDGTLHVRSLADSRTEFDAHAGTAVLGIGLTGPHAIVLGTAGRLSAWNLASGARDGEQASPDSAIVAGPGATPLAVSRADGQVAVGYSSGLIATWQWNGTRFSPGYTVPSDDGEVLHAAIQGDYLAVAHRGGPVAVRDRHDGRLLMRIAPASTPFAVGFSPDGRWLAVGTWVGIVDIWDVATGARRVSLTGHSRLVPGLDFSPDGSILASAGRDGTVRLWDAGTGRPLATVASRERGASRVRFVTNDRLAIGYENGEVEVRDLSYFFRHVAGQAEYQRELLERAHGRPYPRAAEVLDWSRRALAAPFAIAPAARR
jgi:eukaryotic-like serine/threonine-protein kinase